ncbi:hypothetical protein SDC9_44445 [bioreactor metagenome]|uniref:Uncharacterized protein n=1 Tax=bioreactor metagenome TaxID=1076179 RepID=A0A644W3E0_9ZZZZ
MCIVAFIELGTTNEGDTVADEGIVKVSMCIRCTVGGDEQIAIVEEGCIGSGQLDLYRPLPQLTLGWGSGAGRHTLALTLLHHLDLTTGTAEHRLVGLHELFDRLVVEGRGFPLFKGDGSGRTYREAVAQSITIVFAQKNRLAVDQADGSLLAGADTEAATVALLFIYSNHLSDHNILHCLESKGMVPWGSVLLCCFYNRRGNPMDVVQILLQSVLFTRIQDENIEGLLSCLKARTSTFPKEYTIIDEGEYTDEMGIILSGSANIVRHDFWGNRTVVANLGVADSFAETIACTQLASEVVVITCEPTTVLFLNIHQVITTCQRGCVHHQGLIENMVRLLSQKNLELMKKMNHITKRSTREKLLSYLSEEAKKRSSRTFTIPFDRQQLADYLCVERSAMSSELSKMRSEGLLEYQKSTFTLYEEE